MSSLSSALSNLVVKESATLTWTIEGFARVEIAKSPQFSPLKSQYTFKLELKSENDFFGLKRVFLELWHNQHVKDSLLCYRISILDANGVKHYTKEYIWNYQVPNYGLCEYNVTSYISRDLCDKLIVNGSLTIYCEVDILGEKPGQLPPQQIESFGKLSENYETLLQSGKWTDFVVAIGDKQIGVHKMILATRSAVFAAMFEHEETQEVKEGRVVIEDVEVEVFELVIRYIYTGKIESLDEHAAELLVAADKYQLGHLKSMSEQSLITNLTAESVCALLLLSDMHNAEKLKSKCIEYMVEHAKVVMLTEGWKKLAESKRIDLVMELFAKSAIKDN